MHPFWDIGRLSYWASWGLKGALGGPGTPGSLAHASSGAAVGTVVEAQQGLTGSQPKSGCHVGISLACLGLSGSIVARESGKPELNYIARQCLSACLASFCWPFSGWDRGKDVKDYYTAWPKVVGIDAVSSPPYDQEQKPGLPGSPVVPVCGSSTSTTSQSTPYGVHGRSFIFRRHNGRGYRLSVIHRQPYHFARTVRYHDTFPPHILAVKSFSVLLARDRGILSFSVCQKGSEDTDSLDIVWHHTE